jgi:hypothetical protein
MNKFILSFCALSLFTACDDFKGVTTVSESMKVTDKKGKTASIASGSYETKFSLDEKDRELKIKIKDSTQDGKDVSLKLMIPTEVSIPRDNGTFLLLGSQIGQVWNLEGQVDTRETSSGTQSGSESCSYESQEYVCHETCDTEGLNCSRSCGYETVYVPGSRDVEYYYTYTTRNVAMKFLAPENEAQLAKFAGTQTYSDIHYTYYGTCQ